MGILTSRGHVKSDRRVLLRLRNLEIIRNAKFRDTSTSLPSGQVSGGTVRGHRHETGVGTNKPVPDGDGVGRENECEEAQ